MSKHRFYNPLYEESYEKAMSLSHAVLELIANSNCHGPELDRLRGRREAYLDVANYLVERDKEFRSKDTTD